MERKTTDPMNITVELTLLRTEDRYRATATANAGVKPAVSHHASASEAAADAVALLLSEHDRSGMLPPGTPQEKLDAHDVKRAARTLAAKKPVVALLLALLLSLLYRVDRRNTEEDDKVLG